MLCDAPSRSRREERRQRDNRLRRRLAVIGGERIVALLGSERVTLATKRLPAFRLFALQFPGRLVERRAGEPRLSLVDLLPGAGERAVDDVVEVGLDRPSGDLLFVDFDGVAHRLLHAVEIERPVARDPPRHLADEAFGDSRSCGDLLGVVLDQEIEDRRHRRSDLARSSGLANSLPG